MTTCLVVNHREKWFTVAVIDKDEAMRLRYTKGCTVTAYRLSRKHVLNERVERLRAKDYKEPTA